MPLSRRQLLVSAAAGMAIPAAAVTPAAPEGTGPAPVALKAQRAMLRLPGAAEPTEVLSFDGSLGGPVLRTVKGQALTLTLANGLDTALVLQWHGLRGANGTDGDWPLAGQPVAAGATAAIRFTPPDSGLYWFHPAPLPGGPDLTARGLRGVLLVEEPAPPVADRDILLAVADWPAPDPASPARLTVNGRPAPETATLPPGARLRLRFVNATTTRAMILAVEGARPLILAIDGQPSDLFEPVADSVPAGPGARFEFVIDLPREPGATVRVTLKTGGAATSLFEGRTEGTPREPLPAAVALPANPALAPAIPLEKSARADLRIEAVEAPPAGRPARWRLNGAASLDLAKAPLLSVRRGASVTLGFDNRSTAVVPVRLHGHVMRLLHAKDDGWEPYWRDSVILLPRSITHVAFVADNPGRWLIDSALFDQAAFGLRSWFEVR